MLVQAEHQNNLPGRVAIDELPRTGRVLRRTTPTGGDGGEASIGTDALTPNLFQTTAQPPGALPPEEEPAPATPPTDEPPPSGPSIDAPDLDAQPE
jgi:hypothetical protein